MAAPVRQDAPFDQRHLRHVLGHFCSGVTVVTAMEGGSPVGVACQSFTSLSLEPPLVAVCAGNGSTTWPLIRAAGRFCANVLAEHQEDMCRAFAVSGGEKFAGVSWSLSPGGSPVLDGVLAWVDCALEAEFEAGDHVIVIGRVLGLATTEPAMAPLLFYRGGYGGFRG